MMRAKEFLESKEEWSQRVQQGLTTVSEVRDMLDAAYDMGRRSLSSDEPEPAPVIAQRLQEIKDILAGGRLYSTFYLFEGSCHPTVDLMEHRHRRYDSVDEIRMVGLTTEEIKFCKNMGVLENYEPKSV